MDDDNPAGYIKKGKMKYELDEILDPKMGAVIRQMTCAVCHKRHLQNGLLVSVWVRDREAMTQAAKSCFDAATTYRLFQCASCGMDAEYIGGKCQACGADELTPRC